MGRVSLLPEALANQIAAGEVVERPASAVKELVENAVDAEATTIFVDVEDGGRRLIRVVDDGIGMSREDALLAVQRHATSKIKTAEDLHSIETLGFRGEALPAIASVSRFRLVTRPEDAEVGSEVTIEGGRAPQVRDAGRTGTRIEVRDLFFNVPARLKFLKKTPTEMGHITGLVTAAALAYPYIHFRLTHNGRTGLDFPVAPTLMQRIFQVLGKKVTDHLYEVKLDGPVRVRGFISEPTTNRPNSDGVHTFINGRRVKDKVVNHALLAAYGNLIERGRYPWAVLYVHMPADLVDVNVHPTKAEVRFIQSGQVHQAISRACRITLSSTPWLHRRPRAVYEGARGAGPGYGGLGDGGAAPGEAPERGPSPLPMDAYGLQRAGGGARFEVRERGAGGGGAARVHQELVFDRPSGAQADYGADARGEGERQPYFSRMKILGQARKTFLVCEGADGVHIIDQHAAHERVGYERIKAGYCTSRVARQALLFPVQVELTPRDAAIIEDHAETLDRLGFGFEPFGGHTWQITAIPGLLGQADAARLVRDVIAELADVGHASQMEAKLDLLFSTMACHTVVRAGDSLSEPEIRALLVAMDEVDLGASCPHGRPVLITLPFEELERRLHRR